MKTHTTPVRHILCAASLLLVTGTIASAETTTTTVTTETHRTSVDRDKINDRSPLSGHDRGFVEKIAKIGREEVAISRLAAERASRQEVRDFAKQIIADHEKSDTALSALASSKGLVLPLADRDHLDNWAKKKGKDFDEDYLEKLIDGHKDAVDMMESNATKAEDSDVAAYARNHLAAMQEHLRKAKDLKKLVD